MTLEKNRRLAVLSSLVLSVTLGLLLAVPGEDRGPWKGWIVLVLPPSAAVDSLAKTLANEGYPHILRPETELVDIADYNGSLTALPLEDVGKHLLPGDPRLDSYVQALPRFFQATAGGRTMTLWFLPEGLRLLPLSRRAGAMLAAAGATIPSSGQQAGSAIVMIGLALLSAGGCLLQLVKRRGRTRRVLSMLPWLLLAGRGGSFALALAGAATMPYIADRLEGWMTNLVRGRREAGSGAGRGLALFALTFPFWASFVLRPGLLGFFFMALIASLSLLLLHTLAKAMAGQSGRRRFVALRIAGNPSSGFAALLSRAGMGSALLACSALVSLLPLPPFLSAGGSGFAEDASLVLPLPLSPDRVMEMAVVPSPFDPQPPADKPLPTLEDYAVHLEFQRGFFMQSLNAGAEGKRPRLQGNDPAMTTRSSPTRPLSIERMLRDQGGGGLVVRNRALRDRGAAPLAPGSAILYILPMVFAALAALASHRGYPTGRNPN